MAVLEAWAHGVPVLMTPECHLDVGFEQGAAMRIAPSVDSIAVGLEDLVAVDQARRSEMGLRGRQLVETRYTWNPIARQMRDVYQWVLGGGPAPETVRKT